MTVPLKMTYKLNIWRLKNYMVLHEDKIALYASRKSQIKRVAKLLKPYIGKKTLDVLVRENRTCTASAHRRFSKAMRESSGIPVPNNLNAYKDHNVPIVSYESEVWYPIKGNIVLTEELRK